MGEADLLNKLRRLRRLTPDLKKEIAECYRRREERALRLVKKRRVLKLGGGTGFSGDQRHTHGQAERLQLPRLPEARTSEGLKRLEAQDADPLF